MTKEEIIAKIRAAKQETPELNELDRIMLETCEEMSRKRITMWDIYNACGDKCWRNGLRRGYSHGDMEYELKRLKSLGLIEYETEVMSDRVKLLKVKETDLW